MILTLVLVVSLAVPDPILTPGDTRPLDTAQICAIRWGRDVRHVTQTMKVKACQAYKAVECPGPRWELDHLVSRELGGADTIKNLWPQPIREARLKDRLENRLHKMMCAGTLSLLAVQDCIRDWISCYLSVFGRTPQ